ncbi:MAG TPA: helix-turn-helix transcriptional regulator [Acidimicrobiales bacterium]|nr:helix-turn-helix transcriptional regulator [Acidimicrobiales bacterium]
MDTDGEDEVLEERPGRRSRALKDRVIKEQSQSLQAHLETLGNFIHSQRKLANLSLRELAERTNVSNPYLSQIERGLHEPSVRVLRSIARALNVSAETLLAQAGILEGEEVGGSGAPELSTEDAIRADRFLSNSQKEALLTVYRSYRAASA